MESNRVKKNRRNEISYFDYSLLFITVFIICFGLVMLYSASSYEASMTFGDSKHYLTRQVIFVIAGAGGAGLQ